MESRGSNLNHIQVVGASRELQQVTNALTVDLYSSHRDAPADFCVCAELIEDHAHSSRYDSAHVRVRYVPYHSVRLSTPGLQPSEGL